jgi:hypothetical protein
MQDGWIEITSPGRCDQISKYARDFEADKKLVMGLDGKRNQE